MIWALGVRIWEDKTHDTGSASEDLLRSVTLSFALFCNDRYVVFLILFIMGGTLIWG